LPVEESDYIDICPIGNIAREVVNTHERLCLATAEVLDGWTAALRDRLCVAGLDRSSANGLANTIIATLEGGFMLARSRRSTADLRVGGKHMQHLIATSLENRT